MRRVLAVAFALAISGLAAGSAQAGLLELLFGGPGARAIRAPAPAPMSYAPLEQEPAIGRPAQRAGGMSRVSRGAREGAARVVAVRQSGAAYCVRTCDGFYFPLGAQAGNGISDAQMCALACPDAPMDVYRRAGDDMGDAVGPMGRLYRDLPRAFTYRTASVAACGCRKPATYAEWAARLLADPTLRRGDMVVNEDGAAVATASARADRRPIRTSDLRDIRAPGAVSSTAWREADKTLGFTVQKQLAHAAAFAVASSHEPIGIVVTPSRGAFNRSASTAPAALPAAAVTGSVR